MDDILAAADLGGATASLTALAIVVVGITLVFVATRLSKKGVNLAN